MTISVNNSAAEKSIRILIDNNVAVFIHLNIFDYKPLIRWWDISVPESNSVLLTESSIQESEHHVHYDDLGRLCIALGEEELNNKHVVVRVSREDYGDVIIEIEDDREDKDYYYVLGMENPCRVQVMLCLMNKTWEVRNYNVSPAVKHNAEAALKELIGAGKIKLEASYGAGHHPKDDSRIYHASVISWNQNGRDLCIRY